MITDNAVLVQDMTTYRNPSAQDISDLATRILTTRAEDISYETCYRTIWYYCMNHSSTNRSSFIDDIIHNIIPDLFARLYCTQQLYPNRSVDITIRLLHDILLYPCRVRALTLDQFTAILHARIRRTATNNTNMARFIINRQI